MGLLSGLLGFRNRALVTISFYGDNSYASWGVVEYSDPRGRLNDHEWSWIALLYIAKTLNTLGDPDAAALVALLASYTEAVFERPMERYLQGDAFPSPLSKEVELIAPVRGAGGIAIDVLQRGNQTVTIQTRLPSGVTRGQLAISVWVAIQSVLQGLSSANLRYIFCLQLGFLANYYREGGSYRTLTSVTEAPIYVASMMSRLGR
ncbi:MAG: hypothetical protein L0177_10790 [Chloroflexi bacterium]|nr:hypothetical protein [Chloroflexota bacterium]